MPQDARLTSVFQEIASDVKTALSNGGSSNTHLIEHGGRFYMYPDGRWVTDSDDNYTPSYYQWAESCTTAEDPVLEWEQIGVLIPKGRTIKGLHLVGKANNNEIPEVEIHASLKHPNPITRWNTGLDNDGEDTHIVLHRDKFFAPDGGDVVFTGNMNDIHLRSVPLNVQMPEIGLLQVCARPLNNTNTSNRYFSVMRVWEIE